MKRMCLLVLLALAGALLGCSTMYFAYQSDMWDGKKFMNGGDYGKARENFVRAAKSEPEEACPYAFAATASYKMDDLEAASRFMEQAVKRDRHGDAHIRILGYRALILLKEGKEKEGLQALNDYMLAYQKDYGIEGVREVPNIMRSSRIDLAALQQNVDAQIGIYESDLDQFHRSKTGWLAQRYGTATPATGGGGFN